ncbi:MAG TPA: D-alanine--D-alanine ligase [Thermodesulfobacteriota bacterium]|nr:D-alanine--D-alanine ligase [Thermodesulfobacteriota bacterium]
MKVEKVRIIYNDDGPERVNYKGEDIVFGDVGDTAKAVSEALCGKGFKTVFTPLRNGNLDWFLKEVTAPDCDMVFNLCEGAFEKSAFEMNVAALLELYGVKFTGNSALTLGVALNKGWAKAILKNARVPTASYVIADTPVSGLPQGLCFPLIVKPVSEDASIGINADSVVGDGPSLERAVKRVLVNHKQSAIIEEYVPGREFNVSVIGKGNDARAFPPSEIDYSNYPPGVAKVCGYEAKWIEKSPFYMATPPVCPANVPEELKERLSSAALLAYAALDCRDYARVDMRLASDGGIRVLEVNPNPDISVDAGLARAAKAHGLGYADFIAEIIGLAERRYQ